VIKLDSGLIIPAASREKKLELKINKRPPPTLQGDQEKFMELKQRDQSHLFAESSGKRHPLHDHA
jgi:hypothetical protein